MAAPGRQHRRERRSDGVQWRQLGPDRAIGCVVYPAAEIVAPA